MASRASVIVGGISEGARNVERRAAAEGSRGPFDAAGDVPTRKSCVVLLVGGPSLASSRAHNRCASRALARNVTAGGPTPARSLGSAARHAASRSVVFWHYASRG